METPHRLRDPLLLAAALLASLSWPTLSHATHWLGTGITLEVPFVIEPGETVEIDDANLDPTPHLEAQYLILHFRSGLSDGAQLVVELGYGGEEDVFTEDSGDEFWSRPVRSGRATVRHEGGGDGLVVLDQYGRGERRPLEGEVDLFEGVDLFMISGSAPNPKFEVVAPTWENVACLDEGTERAILSAARSVGMILAIADASHPNVGCKDDEEFCVSSCSAALVDVSDVLPGEDGQYILTAAHCFRDDSEIEAASFTLDFQTDCDDSRPEGYEPRFYKLKRVVRSGWERLLGCCELDYSIIEIETGGEEIGTPLRMAPSAPRVGDPIFIVHHPRGASKKVSRCDVSSVSPPDFGFAGADGCDVDNGSSGSPVLQLDGDAASIAGVAVSNAVSAARILKEIECDTGAGESGTPLNYEVLSVTAGDGFDGRTLVPGEELSIAVRYRLVLGCGPRCAGEVYQHRVYLADPADPERALGAPLATWTDAFAPGDEDEQRLRFEVPCPPRNGGTYQVCVALNYFERATENCFDDNRECVPLEIEVCHPDVQLTAMRLTQARRVGGAVVYEEVALCDEGGGCRFGETFYAELEVCNLGCAATGPFEIDLKLDANLVVFDVVLCRGFEMPLLDPLFPFDGLGAAPPDGEVCELIYVPFVFTEPEDPSLGNFRICATADPGGELEDCARRNNVDCTPALPCDDPCLIGACDPVDPPGGADGEDGFEDDEDRGRFGHLGLGGCCPSPDDGPGWCFRFFGAGPGAPPSCGDPGFFEPVGLFRFGSAIDAALAAQGDEDVAQALGALRLEIDGVPILGPNTIAPLRDFARLEVEGLLGSTGGVGAGDASVGRPSDLTARDLKWTRRLFNAYDLDLRSRGLEAPATVPAGENVTVLLGGGLTLTFDRVSAPGTVTPRFRQFGPRWPRGFQPPIPYHHVDLEGALELAPASSVTVNVHYAALSFPEGAEVRLFEEDSGALLDRTLHTDPGDQKLSARLAGLSRLLLGAVRPAQGHETVDLPPTQDAYVSSPAGQSENFGQAPDLLVGLNQTPTGASFVARSFLEFELAGALPPAAEVESAVLRLYQYFPSLPVDRNPVPVGVHRVLVPWSESSATWLNQPASDNPLLAQSTPPDAAGYHEWELTEAVRGWLADPASNFGVALRNTVEEAPLNGRGFLSKEAAENRPQLRVRYLRPPVPDIEVTPVDLAFEDVPAGAASLPRTVEVRNSGDGTLDLRGLMLAAPQFSLLNPYPLPVELPRGGSVVFQVFFVPAASGVSTGTLSVESDDPDEPVVTIALSGRGLAGERFIRGDPNASGGVDLSDSIFTLGYLFLGSAAPSCLLAADANADGEVDVADAIFALNFLFLGTRPIPPPYPGCGEDVGAAALSCKRFAPCGG